jgi:hypothetical protein
MSSKLESVLIGAVLGISLYHAYSYLLSSKIKQEGTAKKEADVSHARGEESWIGVQHPATVDTNCVYLDYNATTPIFPEVAEAMKPFSLNKFGNPSSPHIYGVPCANSVDQARKYVAELIGAESGHLKVHSIIVFIPLNFYNLIR